MRFIILGIHQFISGLKRLRREGKMMREVGGAGEEKKRINKRQPLEAVLAPWLRIGAPGLSGIISGTSYVRVSLGKQCRRFVLPVFTQV